ncbi:hypothetical protein [Ruminococcus sp.]|uniref:hypothetical protein n=1 Tax=Ruminococcus sp. TaxID=41978 RepID=UPI00388E4B3B
MADEELKLFEESELERDLKKRVSIWLRASTRKRIEEMYQLDGCKSKSDYVERAVAFYTGYVLSDKADSYLSNMITSSLKSIIRESDNRLSRLIFKLAVELAITMNVVAANQGVDKEVLNTLRGECIKEVKKTNGIFTFDEADKWQKGL